MPDADQGLDAALRERLAASDRPAGTPHPDDADWERFATGSIGDAQRMEIVDHALACPQCRPLLRTLGELRKQAFAADPRLAERRVPARLPLWIGLAAAVLVLVAWPARWPPRGPATPAGGDAELRSGRGAAPVETLAPLGSARRPLAAFSWRPVAGADAYRVRLFSVDGRLIWESPRVASPATAVTLGPEVALPAGSFVWSVEAERDGDVVATSRLATFELPE